MLHFSCTTFYSIQGKLPRLIVWYESCRVSSVFIRIGTFGRKADTDRSDFVEDSVSCELVCYT